MNELLELLEQGTSLICSLADGRISIQAFLREYGDFYHYNALDGHEQPLVQLAGMSDHESVVSLHDRVQAIVYQVYESDLPIHAYEQAGRILPNEAKERIAQVARELDAPRLLRNLQETRARRGKATEA